VTLFVTQGGNLKRQRASQIAGFVAALIGAAAFIGLSADLPVLSSWGTGFPIEKPLGALGVTAFGLALMHPGKDSGVAFLVGITVAVSAALGLVLVLFNVELGINRWLAPEAAVPPGSFRLVSAALVTFVLGGSSLALSRFERHRLAATFQAGLVFTIAVFALLGYLTGIDTLYGSVLLNSPPPAGHRWPALRRYRDHLADRNDARAPQAPAVVAPAGHARMHNRCAAPAVRRIRGISHHQCAAPRRSGKPDD
jgi:hypothetical protein